MKLRCLARGYASYGASIFTSAAEHLELALDTIEPIDLLVDVTAFLPHDGPAKPTLESSLERHIARFPHQIRVRYMAKANRLDIDFPSSFCERESFGRPGGIYAVADNFSRAFGELSEAVVGGLRSKPSIWNKIDVSQLSAAIEESKASLPTTTEKIIEYMRNLDDRRRASAAIPSSIDDLDIEWKQYHPSAKTTLDNPFFWSEADDDAPHGNDTGSDLLAAFKRWHKRNPATPYDNYVDRLLARWGLTSEQAIRQIAPDQLTWIRQEADIALAFAAIKLRGRCEVGPANTALAALNARLEKLGGTPERYRKVALLREKLRGQ